MAPALLEQPLCSYLNGLQQKADLGALAAAFERSVIGFGDVEPWCVFGDTGYRRHLIGSSSWYELLLICWKAGQSSLIHDHQDSVCAFRVISGVASETIYQKLENNSVRSLSTRHHPTGLLCLAGDKEIHRIFNEDCGESLVTLHVYSPPLKMTYYEAVS